MGAPEYVPTTPQDEVRSYASPPRRPASWRADRPGEVVGRWPEGDRLGTPGPDQGYAIGLADRFQGRLQLHDGDDEADALAGASAIGMKRAGLFGRAPVVHDIEAGLCLWGYLDADVDPVLVELRRGWFEEVHQAHHYMELRRVVDAVRDEVLHQSLDAIAAAYADDWRACLDLTV